MRYGFNNTKIWWWLHKTVICLISPYYTLHEGKNPAWSQWLFGWSKELFVEYVFANNKEITVQALLRCLPISDWDKETGSSQNVTDCEVEDRTCIEVNCGGTLELGNCWWATDGVWCQDWLHEPQDFWWPGCPQLKSGFGVNFLQKQAFLWSSFFSCSLWNTWLLYN